LTSAVPWREWGPYRTEAVMSAFPDLRSAAQATIAQARMSGMVMFALGGDGPIEVIAIGNDAAGVALDPNTLFSDASVTKLAAATRTPGSATPGDSPDSAEYGVADHPGGPGCRAAAGHLRPSGAPDVTRPHDPVTPLLHPIPMY